MIQPAGGYITLRSSLEPRADDAGAAVDGGGSRSAAGVDQVRTMEEAMADVEAPRGSTRI